MTTFVGTQANFADGLKELAELDYDAVEAYEAAINRLENDEAKAHFKGFADDHRRHIKELNEILRSHGLDEVKGPGAKQWLAKGKVVLGGLIGDDSIMMAMRTNEEDTNKAYERMCQHEDVWEDAKKLLQRGWDDEKRHKQWIETHGGA